MLGVYIVEACLCVAAVALAAQTVAFAIKGIRLYKIDAHKADVATEFTDAIQRMILEKAKDMSFTELMEVMNK